MKRPISFILLLGSLFFTPNQLSFAVENDPECSDRLRIIAREKSSSALWPSFYSSRVEFSAALLAPLFAIDQNSMGKKLREIKNQMLLIPDLVWRGFEFRSSLRLSQNEHGPQGFLVIYLFGPPRAIMEALSQSTFVMGEVPEAYSGEKYELLH